MDLKHYYLGSLEADGKDKLKAFRERVPGIVETVRQESPEAQGLERLTVWRVDIAKQSDASDIVLLKYLRAEELDVDKAVVRLEKTLIFRADCRIDELREAELPEHFQGHDFISGLDADGRPVMVSRFGTMDIDKVFADTEAFVRYRAKLMEQAIKLLKFERGSAEDLCQIHDYSGVISSMYKMQVKSGVTAVSQVFAEHYPEFKGRTMFVNFPAIFAKPFNAFALLLPERTRKKFVILGGNDHLCLFEHVSPDLVPESIGGLHRSKGRVTGPGKVVNPGARAVEEVTMLELEGSATVHWEVRVCVAEVSYEVEFVPTDGGEAEVVSRRGAPDHLRADEGVVSGEWAAKCSGKVICRFRNDNAWFKSRVCICRAVVLP